MAWNTASVALGETTKKSHYDRLRQNDQAIASGSFSFYGAKTFYSATVFKKLITFSATAQSNSLIKSTKGIEAPYAEFNFEENVNTTGGTATTGAWRKLTDSAGSATQKTNTVTGLSISAGVITLPAGTYDLESWHSFWSTGRTNLRFRDLTNNATLVIGESGGYNSGDKVFCNGRFTITGEITCELEYNCSSTKTTDGLGLAANHTEKELYGKIVLTKIG